MSLSEEYRQIIEEEAGLFIKTLLDKGYNMNRHKLAKPAFKDGYEKCLEDFSAPDMIDALIESQVLLKILFEQQCGDYESMNRQIRENRKALSKAGITINETGDE